MKLFPQFYCHCLLTSSISWLPSTTNNRVGFHLRHVYLYGELRIENWIIGSLLLSSSPSVLLLKSRSLSFGCEQVPSLVYTLGCPALWQFTLNWHRPLLSQESQGTKPGLHLWRNLVRSLELLSEGTKQPERGFSNPDLWIHIWTSRHPSNLYFWSDRIVH